MLATFTIDCLTWFQQLIVDYINLIRRLHKITLLPWIFCSISALIDLIHNHAYCCLDCRNESIFISARIRCKNSFLFLSLKQQFTYCFPASHVHFFQFTSDSISVLFNYVHYTYKLQINAAANFCCVWQRHSWRIELYLCT